MATSTLSWLALWETVLGLILSPATCGRIMVALDESINDKTRKFIFGRGHFHNHASKGNQTSYPWSQCLPSGEPEKGHPCCRTFCEGD